MTEFCSCRDVDSNPDFVACEDAFQQIYLTCIGKCPHGDYPCLAKCNREYEASVKDCPCQENCPNGCPCPNYSCRGNGSIKIDFKLLPRYSIELISDCESFDKETTTKVITTTTATTTSTSVSTSTTTTTTTISTTTSLAQNKTVLVLNSWNGWKPALLLDATGRQDELDCFSHDENAEAYQSCSLTWQNQLHIFGGNSNRRQISRLSGYRLEFIGSLPFDHHLGACTNFADQKIFLCFNYYIGFKTCRWSREPLGTFEQATLASYDHRETRISSSNGKLFESWVKRIID